MNAIHRNDRIYALEVALRLAQDHHAELKVQFHLRELLDVARREAEMGDLVLVPPTVSAAVPVRMRQPTKDAYRQWLAEAHDLVEQLQAEVGYLRAGQPLPAEQHRTLAELITVATALGHHDPVQQ